MTDVENFKTLLFATAQQLEDATTPADTDPDYAQYKSTIIRDLDFIASSLGPLLSAAGQLLAELPLPEGANENEQEYRDATVRDLRYYADHLTSPPASLEGTDLLEKSIPVLKERVGRK